LICNEGKFHERTTILPSTYTAAKVGHRTTFVNATKLDSNPG
jgi:hypothetical protein